MEMTTPPVGNESSRSGGRPSLSTPPPLVPIPSVVAAAVPNLGTLTHTTAMCWAAAEGNVEMMRKLREHGADVNAADYDKRCEALAALCSLISLYPC